MEDNRHTCRFTVDSLGGKRIVPVSLAVLLGAPQGSSFFEPSPNGSFDVEESVGGAGEPHTSSVFTGAAAAQKHNSLRKRSSFLHHGNRIKWQNM